ncbi:MFS transporter [Metabacillus halosaccharovorans]|uniref:MFS transporter n=1 Tax=Metabacillus halosaccharovorans TaxID=930124 RepID=UPI002041068B|nr:MFS transporter [Metabacillus halosaccharovorans]MCM3441756.1 MFS transporter [Metabacillus halosaccharovorans]
MKIFRNRNFVKLFFAALFSQMGTTIGNMAFAFYLLDHFSHQPSYATIAELMYSLPTILVFFIVGVVADRFDRKKVAENCDWIRAALTVLLFGALFTNSIPFIFLVLFLRSAVTKFFFPAENSLVQGILNKEQYAQAAGLNQMLFSIFMVFGVGLGAAIYKTVGIHGAVIVDFMSFIFSALLIRSCQIPTSARLPNGKVDWKDVNIKSSLGDFKDGILYIIKNRLLSVLIFGFFIFGFFNGAFAILPMFTMKYELSPENYEWYASLFAVSLGFGLLTGSGLGTLIASKFKPHQLMIFPIFLTSLLIFFLGFTDKLSIFLVIVFIIGTCLGPINIAIGGWMPKIVHPKLMGRVSGWIDPLMMFAQSATLGLIALLFPKFIQEIDYLYYGIAFVILLVSLFYAFTLPKLSEAFEKKQKLLQRKQKTQKPSNIPSM